MKKVCFVASTGGHWEELMCLEEIAEENYSFYVTEKSEQTSSCDFEKIYFLKQINRREKFFLIHFIGLFISAGKILWKEKPDVIITTGALLAFPFCVIGKLMRKKIIFIESFARIHTASLTGKLVYPIADLFIVQWESMLLHYPKAVFKGSIF